MDKNFLDKFLDTLEEEISRAVNELKELIADISPTFKKVFVGIFALILVVIVVVANWGPSVQDEARQFHEIYYDKGYQVLTDDIHIEVDERVQDFKRNHGYLNNPNEIIETLKTVFFYDTVEKHSRTLVSKTDALVDKARQEKLKNKEVQHLRDSYIKFMLTYKKWYKQVPEGLDTLIEGNTIKQIYLDEYNNIMQQNGKQYNSNSNVRSSTSDKQTTRASNNFQHFVTLKDTYNTQITNLAQEINSYIQSHGDLRGANAIFNKCKTLQDQIDASYNDYLDSISGVSSKSERQALLQELLELERTRISGLYNGVRVGLRGENYMPHFSKGTDASYKYDDVEEKFKRAGR